MQPSSTTLEYMPTLTAFENWSTLVSRQLCGVIGVTPTMADWDNHLTTAFPEVRLKRFLEMRGADGGLWR